MLADYEMQRENLIGANRLVGRCVDGDGKRICTGTRRECARRRPPMLAMQGFEFCPERERVTPEWDYAMGLYNAKAISPLEGWPSRYTPATTAMLSEIEAAAAREARRKAEAAARKGRR